MIYYFKHYRSMCGTVKIEAKNENEARSKFKQLNTSDLEWRSDPSGKYRTTYEVICEDATISDNKAK